MDVQYPVLVEGRQHYLLWVEAESAEEAARQVNDDPDYLSQVQPYDSDWTATAPDADDYSWTIYGHSGAASRYDAHVQAHRVELYRRERAEKVAVCAKAGHPLSEVYSTGSVWCEGCSTYLEDAPSTSAGGGA